MRGATSRAATGGRHAQPKRRADGPAVLLPALTATRAGGSRPGRRRADGTPRVVASGGRRRAPRRVAAPEPARVDAAERLPWARTVAFSGVTGVAALTVGLSVVTDPDSASGLGPQPRPQQTAAVTVIERTAAEPRPVARRTAPARYDAPRPGRSAVAVDDATTGDEPAAPATGPATGPAPVAATPTSRPTTAPAPAPPTTSAPQAPGTKAPAPAPAPEETTTPGLLDGLTGTLDDTLTGVLGSLPGLGG